MMKRILSSILAIILLLSMCCVSAAEDNSWTADMESKHYILNQLGIVEIEGAVPYVTLTGDAQQVLSYMVSDEHTDFKDISKSAFVNFLCNIIGNYGFNDQANDEAIEIAEGYGIIHKGQDDLYKSLTYEEALTMLVRLLGYGEHAEMGGGFPQGYISIATRLGLNKGITAGVGENLKVYEAITLLYNAINCAYVEIMWFTNEEIVYGDTSDKTLLYEFRKIYRIEGVVEATGTVALSDSKAVGAQQTMIDGYIYNTNVDLTDMLGLEVEAYVQEDSKNGDIVLFVFPHKNNKQLTITDENIIAVSEDFRQISYYDKNDRKKEAVISPIAKVLYNGQPLAKYTEDKFKPEDGSIMLIENDGSTGYDIVHIQSFKTVVVGSVSPSNLTVGNAYSYDENNQIINLEAKTDDVIRIFDAEGKETEISALLPGDVLRVAESAGSSRRTVTVYVSSEKITGAVEKIKNGDRTEVAIGGKEYILSKIYEKALEKKDPKALMLETGKSYTFYLDNVGKIVYAGETSSGHNYGIVMSTAETGIPGMGGTCIIKLYDADKGWLELECADKINYDGAKGVDPSTKIGQLETVSDGGDLPLIAYELNADGKIKSIDLAEADDGEGNGGRFNTSGEVSYAYRPNNFSFDSKYFINDGAKIIFVNSKDVKDEKSYFSGIKSHLVIDATYYLYAYEIDDFAFADLFVVKTDSSATTTAMLNAEFFIVEEIAEAINSEGDNVKMVTGMTGNYLSISYCFAEDKLADGLGKGDVIAIHTDTEGNIDYLTKYRTGSVKDVYQSQTNLQQKPAVVQGKVKKAEISNGRIKVACDAAGNSIQVLRVPSTATVFVYEKAADRIYKGTVNDIEMGDMVAVRVYMSGVTTVVIYR